MKTITLGATSLAIACGLAALAAKADSMAGVFFFVPFALGPLFVTMALAFLCQRDIAQRLLLISTGAYALWFSWVYWAAFYRDLDPQSAIAMIFVGLYSLPVMFLFWIAALLMRKVRHA